MYEVPRLWPGETFCCIASGPSLTPEDAAAVRGQARVIAVNSSYLAAPWADVLYACDDRWWQAHQGAKSFPGLKFTVDKRAQRWPGVQAIEKTGTDGLETRRIGVRTGQNSGYQALNLAVHLGAKRILLLGYDMQRGPKGEEHWHADYPWKSRSPFEAFVRRYQTLVEPLQRLQIDVVNCSRRSALTMFPQAVITDVLQVAA